ncbi:MAG: hypothetical protein KC442_09120 [Thermomicrobiales bacterium]|nr:hypothetical protein [Thermomicrobiales bacterium]
MSEPAGQSGSGRWHLIGILLVTVIVMVLGVAVVVAPDRMGVPQIPATPIATPVATAP